MNGTRDLAQEFEGITSGEKTTTVAEYLGRYRLVHTSHFSSRTHFSVSNFFNQDQMKQKLFGSLGVSGTMKFKIVWNADPTVQGFYIMSYTPPAVTASPHPDSYMNDAMFHSGCPHVKINISKDTSAELSVPYIGETPYIPLLWENNWISAQQVGSLNLTPLVGTESSSSPVTVS